MQHREPTKYYTQLSKVMIEKMIPVNDLFNQQDDLMHRHYPFLPSEVRNIHVRYF